MKKGYEKHLAFVTFFHYSHILILENVEGRIKLINTSNNMRYQRQGYFNSNYASCVNQACPCQREQDVLFDLPIAMAYVPWQKWEKIYDIQKGFQQGTIFEKLDKPFRGKGGCNR